MAELFLLTRAVWMTLSLQRIRVSPKMIVQSNSVCVHTRTRAENPVFNFVLLLSIRVYVQTRGDRLETSWTWNETLVNSFHRIHWCPLTPLFQLIIPRLICTFSLLNFVSLSLHRLKLRLQRNNSAVAKRNEAGKSFKRVKNVSVEWKIEEDRFFVSKRNEFGHDIARSSRVGKYCDYEASFEFHFETIGTI